MSNQTVHFKSLGYRLIDANTGEVLATSREYAYIEASAKLIEDREPGRALAAENERLLADGRHEWVELY